MEDSVIPVWVFFPLSACSVFCFLVLWLFSWGFRCKLSLYQSTSITDPVTKAIDKALKEIIVQKWAQQEAEIAYFLIRLSLTDLSILIFLSLTDLSIFIFLAAGKEMDMGIPNNASYLNIEDLSSLKQLQEWRCPLICCRLHVLAIAWIKNWKEHRNGWSVFKWRMLLLERSLYLSQCWLTYDLQDNKK